MNRYRGSIRREYRRCLNMWSWPNRRSRLAHRIRSFRDRWLDWIWPLKSYLTSFTCEWEPLGSFCQAPCSSSAWLWNVLDSEENVLRDVVAHGVKVKAALLYDSSMSLIIGHYKNIRKCGLPLGVWENICWRYSSSAPFRIIDFLILRPWPSSKSFLGSRTHLLD